MLRFAICAEAVVAGKPNGKGRLSTFDLLVLTSFNKPFSLLKILFIKFTKQGK
jgi:hypothetical protein